MSNTAVKESTPETVAKRNVTITACFPNDKFGTGALLSAAIDGAAYDAMIKNVQIGVKLLLKPAKSKDGRPVYFLEVLPQRVNSYDGI